MTERFAYVAFLIVVGAGLVAMTVSLALILWFLIRRNRMRPGRR